MKFMSFRTASDPKTRLGWQDGDRVVDLGEVARSGQLEIDPDATLTGMLASPGGLDELTRRVETLPPAVTGKHEHALESVTILAPVPRPMKIFGIGLNYHDHAEEVGMEKPSEPLLFAMFANTVIGPGEAIVIPEMSGKIDYEAELGVVIGRGGRHIPVEKALEHVGGYTIVHDVSARDLQFRDNQWVRGKSFDTFLPMGPVLVSPGALGDAGNLAIELRLNGQTMQKSSTSNLIFNVPELVSFISRVATLEPGDVIATGTPGGVGFTRKPPVYLKSGDVVDIELEGIGILSNPVTR
jgi:2-keto-4-pentenoate hydratase/2-oxohepta-3-ene-1,7-dioic acid hydratase in catechol pathway